MTKLSVNINKVATLRNARGGNLPDVVQFAKDCERFGADGITVHPRPDERHIRSKDVHDLKKVVTTEFNIEGYPDKRFMQMMRDIRPQQATLVPDPPHVLTSGAGWNVSENMNMLKDIIAEIKSYGIRVSIFLNAETEQVHAAKESGTDRIEFYTGPYAENFRHNRETAIKDYITAANLASEKELGINAGHDLNLENLAFFNQTLIRLDEVSIGHALISDALYYGIENTIQLYKRQLQ